MPDDSRFIKEKSIATKVIEIFGLIFDVISSIIISVPIVLRAFYKSIYSSRKDIRGKVALVNCKLAFKELKLKNPFSMLTRKKR